MTDAPRFYPVRLLAAAASVSKPTLVARAREGAWPERRGGNRLEFCPPPEIRDALPTSSPENEQDKPLVNFTDIKDEVTRQRILYRQGAVLHYQDLGTRLSEPQLELGEKPAPLSVEARLQATAKKFAAEARGHRPLPGERNPFAPFTARQLRRWVDRYERFGLNGLVDQKQGRVGHKPVQVPDEVAARLKAGAIELGSVARAVRREILNPDLPAELRKVMHGAHASKSYVTPSVRKAATPAALTAARAQGPRAARLAGRWTPGDWSGVRAGDVFVSDDMTSNVLCWSEWPNAKGWKLGQAQLIPVADTGSLFWLNFRLVMRLGGQYNALDDIWGTFGDVFDTCGLPRDGFILEGGSWQANAVIGHRTGLATADRIGGLSSLGLRVIRSYDPRSKPIESMFNQLQWEMDAFTGYAGRDQRTMLPELVKKQIALCEAGHNHPREFFPHITQLADHVRTVMENHNQERGDGMVLRGQCPAEKWAAESAGLAKLPDTARWLYRSAMSVVQVTKNGVRVTQGSGAKLLSHYYDHPELLVSRQGQKLIVYWNDGNPAADAVLLDFRTRTYIGIAKHVQPLGRFSASDEQLEAEAERKRAALHYARTELRTISPELRRAQQLVPVDLEGERIGQRIAEAAAAAAATGHDRAMTDRCIAHTDLTRADVEAALKPRSDSEELADLTKLF